jgi:predicted dehydrogenase
MADKIRVGIVGATVTPGGSGWGASAHIPALKSLPGYELKAVCTAHEDTAQASAKAFGAELAFSDFDKMIAHPGIDMVSVVVRVPKHQELVMKSLRAKKPTFCEWPLGTNLAEAEEMVDAARTYKQPTLIGLQARSDPAIMTARELIADDYIGRVLVANLSMVTSGSYARGAGRLWQSVRKNGANPLTIPGGHSMDVLRFLVGDFAEVSARVTTQIPQWRDTDADKLIDVDAPDSIGVIARTQTGVEAVIQIATVPSAAPGFRLEIYGLSGRLVLTSSSVNYGPNRLLGAKGNAELAELPIPDRFKVIPKSLPGAPQSTNVAQAYTRFAEAYHAGRTIDPDFDTALGMHRLLDAVERSYVDRSFVRLTDGNAPQ